MFKQRLSLRLKLLVTFILCLALSFVLYYLLDYTTRDLRAENFASYVSSKNEVQNQADYIENKLPQLKQEQELPLLLAEAGKRKTKIKIYLTDTNGRVLYHSAGDGESNLNIHRISYDSQKALKAPAFGKLYAVVTPLVFQEKNLYLVVKGQLYAEKGVIYKSNPLVVGVVFVTIFTVLFYLFTSRKMLQIQEINNYVQQVADGNLLVRIPVRSKDELGTLSDNINCMAQQLKEKIDRERAVEKSKIDLITNVSHDLRTPLTSIIGYLTLLKEKSYQNSDEMDHYISSSYNKAGQLKKLINHVFEYTRLTSEDIRLEKQTIDLREMLEQMIVELEPIAARHNVTIQHELGEEPLPATVDSDKMARTLDNLFVNALKFSVKPGTIKITLRNENQWVVISVGNEGQAITGEQESFIFERFFRVDDTSHAGEMPRGTGLGLAIAKNIVELHGGEIRLERKESYYKFCIKIPRFKLSSHLKEKSNAK